MPTAQIVEKVCFYKKIEQILYPYKNAQRLCVLQSLWAFYLGILAESPNPIPRMKGVYAGAECGAAALTKQGRLQSVAHSRCTMQRHQRLTTRIGATPKARTLWLLAKSYKQGRLCQLNRAVARCNGTNS